MDQIGKGSRQSIEPGSPPSDEQLKQQLKQQKLAKGSHMSLLAKRLFDLYPPQEIGDIRTVMDATIELFMGYPEDVVERAVSPRSGMPAHFKFVPRIAEMREFLDRLLPPLQRAVFPQLPPVDRSKRASYAELQARCASDGLFIGGAKANSFETEANAAARLKAKYGLTDAEFDAIPSRKPR